MEQNLTPIIKDSFIQFSGAVLQSRALPDVRDCMKPSARQIFYCLYTDKFIHSKPYQKTLKAIGSAFRMYIHGDSSAEGVIMRAAQPFAMRYPLIEVEGSYGTLLAAGSWAAPRYTASRLTKLSEYLFADIGKDVIEEWRDNYDNTEQYPMVLPSKGFFNLVNGSYGIGVGASCSVPQYNLRELNEALCKLLDNPDIDFEEIYCVPDFATGAILLNAEEIKESHRNGQGFACKLRSKVDYDTKERCFIVSEIPYMVYTETICKELEEIINGEKNPGIERFNDLTGETPNIKIYLSKKANPDRILKFLYKNTSLQSYYSINFTMLENGRFPKVFGWKELLQAHIDHEKVVYRHGFEFDLRKLEKRIHIIDGLLKAYDAIDEVIQTIKTSANTAAASISLQKLLGIDEVQAKAILDLKLSKLSKLDITKLIEERENLKKEVDRINKILNNEELFKEELKNGWREVSRIFGDDRRTKILSLAEDSNDDVIEERQIALSFTNEAAVYTTETSSLYSQRRNGVGAKFKLASGEYIIDNLVGRNTDVILFFTNKGRFYHMKMNDFIIDEKQYLSNFINLSNDERIVAASLLHNKENIIFITKNGILKKSKLEEYNLKRNTGAAAIKLDDGDEIVSVLFVNDEKIGLMTKKSYLLLLDTKNINAIGRNTRGVIGIKLNEDDYVIAARVIKNDDKEIVTISEDGYAKRTLLNEFRVTGRGTKGTLIQKDKNVVDFIITKNTTDLLVTSNYTQLRTKYLDIPLLSRGAQGTKTLKLSENSKIIKIQQL